MAVSGLYFTDASGGNRRYCHAQILTKSCVDNSRGKTYCNTTNNSIIQIYTHTDK